MMIVACVFALFLLQGHQGFSFTDEGFLWYGAQRVMVGEVPIRDFMAYDIGRYYWSAAFMSLLGSDGIVALRAASTIFQTIALCIGLSVLVRSSAKQSSLFWLLAALTLIFWMTPQYRVFDISLPIILVGSLSFLVEKPTRSRYFLAGVIVGLAAVFGRNHGMYGVAGSIGVIIYLNARHDSGPGFVKASASWAAGVVTGYLPVLVFLAAVPGFAPAFWESIRFLFENKATNIPLPVPWPWLAQFGEAPIDSVVREMLTGMFFIAIVAFGVLGMVWIIRKKLQNKSVSPVLAASVLLALPYVHYAYSRADFEHLAPAIPPFLMGTLALLANQPAKIKWLSAAILCGASLWVVLPTNPWWHCYSTRQCVDIKVAGDNLKVDRGTADDLKGLSNLAEQFAPGNRTFITAPFWPGAYAALERKSPMWEIFALFPQNTTFQQAEIERIKAANPGFAVIYDFALDGREDLRFQNTNPIIDQYIRDNFDPVAVSTPSSPIRIYINRQARR